MTKFMITTVCSMTSSGSCQAPTELPHTHEAPIAYTMPTESAPHEGTWLQWPHEYAYGKSHRDQIEGAWIAMACEIVSGENLHIVAYDADEKARITKLLGEANIPLDNIDFCLFATDDVWVRDNGPIYVRDHSGNLVIEAWGFNGWGGKVAYGYDNQIPQKIAEDQQTSVIDLSKHLTIEGGAFEVDGKGSFVATRSSILNNNRNPNVTQQQAEALLSKYLGITHFIWLNGVAGLEITDMHIDFLVRFGENNTIITMNPEDLIELDLPQKDIDYLYKVNNRDGKPYHYVQIPITQNNVVTTYGKNLGVKGSYLNYYITNNKVLVPIYNDPNDNRALAAIGLLYPTRKVVGIDSRNVYANGGMIHCVTQQQPKKQP